MSKITLRKASPGDLSGLLEIQALSGDAASWSEQDYRRLMAAADSGVFVAAAGEVVIGFLAYRRTAPDEVEILNVAVAPQRRRSGIASKLVRRLVESCEGSIFLEVRSGNAAAIGLYRKMGFRQAGRRPGYYQGPTEDAVLMEFGR